MSNHASNRDRKNACSQEHQSLEEQNVVVQLFHAHAPRPLDRYTSIN
jgi:hypothetical protein